MKYSQIQWTTDSLEEAKEIAHALLEKEWVACVQLIPHVDSFYIWEGKVEDAKEIKVICKTKAELVSQVAQYIIHHAHYEVVDVTELLCEQHNPAYSDWLVENLSRQ